MGSMGEERCYGIGDGNSSNIYCTDGSRCESRSKYGLWEDEQSHYRTCL